MALVNKYENYLEELPIRISFHFPQKEIDLLKDRPLTLFNGETFCFQNAKLHEIVSIFRVKKMKSI